MSLFDEDSKEALAMGVRMALEVALRDQFAGQAMSAILASAHMPASYSEVKLAQAAYRMADAMLEARKQ